MKNHRGIIWAPILIMVGVVVVAGVASYMLFQAGKSNETANENLAVVNQANGNTSVNTNTTTNTSASSNTNTATDPTVGWKTYNDSQGRYSFKYPPEGSLKLIEGVTPEVTFSNGSFTVNITAGKFDPNTKGEFTLQETLSLGDRTWYVTQAGDGPCIWHDSITNFTNQRLQTRAGQCFTDLEDPDAKREPNEFKTNTAFRNSILSTFKFTN